MGTIKKGKSYNNEGSRKTKLTNKQRDLKLKSVSPNYKWLIISATIVCAILMFVYGLSIKSEHEEDIISYILNCTWFSVAVGAIFGGTFSLHMQYIELKKLAPELKNYTRIMNILTGLVFLAGIPIGFCIGVYPFPHAVGCYVIIVLVITKILSSQNKSK